MDGTTLFDATFLGFDLNGQPTYRIEAAQARLVIGAWEGLGAIDYGGESDVIAIKHGADELKSMLQETGFAISKIWTELDDEMQMDAIYIEAAKD